MGQRELVAQAQRNAQEIAAYLRLLDSQDGQEGAASAPGGPGDGHSAPDEVRAALQRLKAEGQAIANEAQQLMRSGASTHASTLVRGEPEARLMRSLNSQPGYNLQTAVETQSHLIVAHEVVCEVSDQRHLQPMAEAASRVLGESCTVVADAGYANGEHIAALDAHGIRSFVADNRAVNNQGDGTLYASGAFSSTTQPATALPARPASALSANSSLARTSW